MFIDNKLTKCAICGPGLDPDTHIFYCQGSNLYNLANN